MHAKKAGKPQPAPAVAIAPAAADLDLLESADKAQSDEKGASPIALIDHTYHR